MPECGGFGTETPCAEILALLLLTTSPIYFHTLLLETAKSLLDFDRFVFSINQAHKGIDLPRLVERLRYE